MDWQARVTVACVVENDGKFLMVEEIRDGRRVFNQPAGHLEAGESLHTAALRETLEETQWRIELQGLIGIGLYTPPGKNATYHRTTFFGRPLAFCPEQPLDSDIDQVHWLTLDQLRQRRQQLRSPMVLDCVERYLAGQRFPLTMIYGETL
ncbi:NUDIX hydrolase [Spongiibacter sp.]|uniref:NUDIX hydrolase n=1 Tax=Spongiibacter sp. TaxID=2024860 RepID=UPI00356777DD